MDLEKPTVLCRMSSVLQEGQRKIEEVLKEPDNRNGAEAVVEAVMGLKQRREERQPLENVGGQISPESIIGLVL